MRGDLARHAFKRRHRSFILTQRTQGTTPPPRRGKELLGRGMSDPNLEPARRDYWLVGPIAARTSSLHSVALRVNNSSTKILLLESLNPVDNPHRGSGDLRPFRVFRFLAVTKIPFRRIAPIAFGAIFVGRQSHFHSRIRVDAHLTECGC